MTKDIEVITLRGDRNLWLDFVYKVKKDKKTIWDILEPMLSKYIKTKN